MEKYDVVVLGAGLTGMSFAYHYDRHIPIFEKESAPGGLARTLNHDGCKFDLAPHFLHLRSDYAKSLVFSELGNEFEKIERHSSIFIHDKIIPYPFELNLSELDKRTRSECLDGVREINKLSQVEIENLKRGSYHDYVLKAFGKGIAHHYLLPYNRKIWDTDPKQMTCEWMKLLPTADKDEIIAAATNNTSKPFGYNASFFYPSQTGIRKLADSLASHLSNIQLNETAVKIDALKRTVEFKSGRIVHYRRLVSTIPLNELADISGKETWKTKARELHWTTVYNINLVVRGMIPGNIHWLYFPDPEIEFYRISFPKKYFTGSAPDDRSIISIEIGSRDHALDIAKLLHTAIARVKKIRIFGIKEILHSYSLIIPVAYCIYDMKRTRIVNELTAELDGLGIKSTGRYGRWEYSAMEDALLYGRDLAAEIRSS
jgi:protoporphyrinogen oxidase